MSTKKLMKKVLIISLSATMVFSVGSFVYASNKGAENINYGNNDVVNYNDFIGEFTSRDSYDKMVNYANTYFNGNIEKAHEDWLYANGYHHIIITRIENGYIYGHLANLYSTDSTHSLDFENDGIKLNANEFQAEVTGEAYPILFTCKLTYEDGIPTIMERHNATDGWSSYIKIKISNN